MSGKNLLRRTIAPRLSKLVDEIDELLKKVHPDTKNFALLISCDEEKLRTRVLPLTDKAMNGLYEASDDKIEHIAHTDKEHNFTGGEEKMSESKNMTEKDTWEKMQAGEWPCVCCGDHLEPIDSAHVKCPTCGLRYRLKNGAIQMKGNAMEDYEE